MKLCRRQALWCVTVLATGCVFAGAAFAARAAAEDENGANALREHYRESVTRIIRETRRQNDAHKKLKELCYGVGNRLSGSENLDKAIDWAIMAMQRDGQENVRRERVMVPRWVRGDESLEMVSPRRVSLPMMGLGGSTNTPSGGVRARLVVVKDRETLERMDRSEIEGRIVMFDHAMKPYAPGMNGTGYGSAVAYRIGGANWAAEKGAVACLIRSVTTSSLRSAHTGQMRYDENAAKRIPAAAITLEDADMLKWLCEHDERVELELKMSARDEGMVPSANVIGELRGRERPDEVVVIGGHIDSWDVGQGAHDDGSGCVMAMEAINVLRKLGLTPRRTIRVVLFTNEENGMAGGRQYAADHAAELDKHIAAIEADSGGFRPTGFSCGIKDDSRQKIAVAQLSAVAELLSQLGGVEISPGGGGGADVGFMKESGVAVMGLDVAGETYFNYHHTHADTVDKVDANELGDSVAAMAAMAYVIADMPVRLGEAP